MHACIHTHTDTHTHIHQFSFSNPPITNPLFTLPADCPTGTELNLNTNVCDPCERGYYRDKSSADQIACVMCPVDFITEATGATAASDCSVGESFSSWWYHLCVCPSVFVCVYVYPNVCVLVCVHAYAGSFPELCNQPLQHISYEDSIINAVNVTVSFLLTTQHQVVPWTLQPTTHIASSSNFLYCCCSCFVSANCMTHKAIFWTLRPTSVTSVLLGLTYITHWAISWTLQSTSVTSVLLGPTSQLLLLFCFSQLHDTGPFPEHWH